MEPPCCRSVSDLRVDRGQADRIGDRHRRQRWRCRHCHAAVDSGLRQAASTADGWPVPTQNGVLFWSSIYIPIVVAMAASQNVRAAVSGGPVAIIAGILVVIVSFAMVPLISRIWDERTIDRVGHPRHRLRRR